VLSRIDRIEESSKNVLKNASVIGEEFSDILLGKMLNEDITKILDVLQEMDFIMYIEDFSVSDISGGIFTFKNEIIREVSYELILKEDRKLLHRRVGEALEEIYSDNIESYLERIAFHYMMAEDERAFDYLKRSADRKFDAYKLDEALTDYEKCLKIKEDCELYLIIGEIYRRKSDYNKADKYYQIAEEMATSDELRGRVKLKKGVLLREKGIFDEALKVLKSAEKFIEGSDKAKLYNELGIIHFSATGKYNLAFDYYNKSLEINLKEFGEESIKVAEIYTNLGALYFDKGDFDKGLEYMKRSLNIKRSILGDTHPQIAINYNNMGVVYATMGNMEEALSNFEKSLDIRLSFFGENSYHAVSCYMNLGLIYKDMGRYEQALKLTRKAIQICLSIGGKENPRIIRSYLNIGLIYMEIGDYNNAMKNYNKCVKLGFSVYDGEHSDIAVVLSKIGILYKNRGKYKKSLANLNKAIDLLMKIFDEKHLHIARTYKIFADVYFEIGDYETSLKYYQKNLNILQDLFGENNLDTYITIRDISRVYEASGEFDKVIENFEKAIDISNEILDDEDNERIYLLSLMSNFYRNIQDDELSQKYFESVEKIYKFENNNYLSIISGMTIVPLLIDQAKYDQVEDILKSCQEFFTRIDNERRIAEVYILYSMFEYKRENVENSKNYADRSLNLANKLKVKPLLIDALTTKALVEENNEKIIKKALNICDEIGDVVRKRKLMRISGV
jgi:tetratricopeptide (TPR) repeat protein